MNAGAGQRSGRIDRPDPSMRHGTAQNRSMQHAVAHDVVDVLAAPAQEAQIFDTLDRAADQRVRLAQSGVHNTPASDGSVSRRISASNKPGATLASRQRR